MDLERLIENWLTWDKDPATSLEIRLLQQANNVQELQRRLASRIRFGTAGLRGRMQAGFAFMNGLTVIQASQGLAKYLLQANPEAERSSLVVVIGRDARHGSAKFASLAASVFNHAGFTVHAFAAEVPTPIVAFRVRHYHATAGVMITASHNPAADNGFKVYGSNGAQITDDVAAAIAKCILRSEEPWTNVWDVDPLVQPDGLRENTQRAYCQRLSAIQKQQFFMSQTPTTAPKPMILYTPMHGVGWHLMDRVACSIHDMDIIPCRPQQVPDPDFPTVSFPNPEEPGALKLALEQADRENINLVLANDPDADRFAAACRKPDGLWHQFTGDQMGVLLASFLIDQERQKDGHGDVVLISTAVSSSMMSRMIQHVGGRFRFEQTLTGFKNIGNKAHELLHRGHLVLFGYEEALGYMFPEISYDKDGIAAASLFLFAVREWTSHGMTPYAKLLDLYRIYGWSDSINTYFTAPNPTLTRELFDQIRDSEELQSLRFDQCRIVRWRDVTNGTTYGDWAFHFTDPESQMLTFEVADPEVDDGNVLFTLRASGTEPKMKIYLEATAPYRDTAQKLSRRVFETLILRWIHNFGTQLTHWGLVTSSLGQEFSVPS